MSLNWVAFDGWRLLVQMIGHFRVPGNNLKLFYFLAFAGSITRIQCPPHYCLTGPKPCSSLWPSACSGARTGLFLKGTENEYSLLRGIALAVKAESGMESPHPVPHPSTGQALMCSSSQKSPLVLQMTMYQMFYPDKMQIRFCLCLCCRTTYH